MHLNSKPPVSFWIIAVLALLWNIAELYFSSVEMNFISDNATPEEYQTIQAIPLWYVVIFLTALFSELLGVFMLFLRKKLAVLFFVISLITLIVVEIYWLFYFNIKNVSVIISVIVPIAVIAIAGFLYVYSIRATKKGWLT